MMREGEKTEKKQKKEKTKGRKNMLSISWFRDKLKITAKYVADNGSCCIFYLTSHIEIEILR